MRAIIGNALSNPSANFDFDAAIGGKRSSVPFYTETGRAPIPQSTQIAGNELSSFAMWYYNTFMYATQFGDKREYFAEKFPVALAGLFAAKNDFSGALFGMGIQGSLHAQAIRPETVASFTGAGSPAAATRTWGMSIATAGAWNVKYFTFNNNNSSSVGLLNTINNVSSVIFALGEYSTPAKLQAFQYVDSGAKSYGAEELAVVSFPNELSYYNLPGAIYIGKDKLGYIDTQFNASGNENLLPIGIQFVTTEYYVLE